MQLYLSSMHWSHAPETLKALSTDYPKLGLISDALDSVKITAEEKEKYINHKIEWLHKQGFVVSNLDLKNYFQNAVDLEKALETLNGIWITGGNLFILRQAMYLSGFDKIFRNMVQRPDFLYAGYSAAMCVLSKNLKPYAFFDNPTDFPYPLLQDTIWEGLGLYDFQLIPHCDIENQPDSAFSNCAKYCIRHKIFFKAFEDGAYWIDTQNVLP